MSVDDMIRALVDARVRKLVRADALVEGDAACDVVDDNGLRMTAQEVVARIRRGRRGSRA